ncbi:MAG: hypothetical protein ABS79_05805 [Planctomycetes bacterium SCN 63-9]|nr:MAG: hypothetical protein ABS79_05805 [Planctomycetes bacterium SCN 63-9]
MIPHDSADQPDRNSPSPEEAALTKPLTRWQKFRLVIKVVELRLRFIALMAGTGLLFAYWDTLWNRYDKWMRPTAEIHASLDGTEYFCPMHPQVIQPESGSCPICGMPLAKRKKGAREQLPEGITARIKLTPFRVEQAGIETVSVSYTPMARTLTTVGTVAVDERRLANIVSKIPGKTRIEKLHVNYNGQEVAAGQPLAELYSPELSQAIQELLASSQDQSFVRLRSGDPGKLPPPVPGYRTTLPPHALAMLEHMGSARAVGSPATVREGIMRFAERTQADELILSGATYDPAARCHSLELTMEALKG